MTKVSPRARLDKTDAPTRHSLGAARPLSEPMAALLLHGDTAGRYDTRSSVAWALAVAAVNARWSFDQWRAAMLDPANEGGAWARERLRKNSRTPKPRTPYDAQARLQRTWAKAAAFVQSRPATGDRFSLVAEVTEIRAVVDSRPDLWGGQAGSTDRLVLDALLAIATEALTLTPTVSCRQVAERANVGAATAARSLRRLAERTPFLALEQQHAGTSAARYRLRRGDPSAVGQGDALAPHAVVQTPSVSARHVSHDAFTYAGLGRSAARVYGLLDLATGHTARDLARALGLSLRTVLRKLRDLQAVGLARWNGLDGTWSADVVDLDELAVDLGTAGTVAARRARHVRERQGFTLHVERFRARRGWAVERGLVDPDQLGLPLDEVQRAA